MGLYRGLTLDNFRMNRLAPRLVQPLVRGTFTRNVTQTRNLTSKTNLLRPVVKVLFSPNQPNAEYPKPKSK